MYAMLGHGLEQLYRLHPACKLIPSETIELGLEIFRYTHQPRLWMAPDSELHHRNHRQPPGYTIVSQKAAVFASTAGGIVSPPHHVFPVQ